LYEVSLDGGPETPLPTDWGYWGSYAPDGRELAFNRHPMAWSRQHYRGSYAADLWVVDLKTRKYRRLVDNDTPDNEKANNFWPMFANGFIYFVSDRSTPRLKAGSPEVLKSTNNIWKVAVNGGEPPIQVTRHKSGRLFFPSLSADGKTIVYEENFGIWRLNVDSGKAREVPIEIQTDDADNNLETVVYNSEADGYTLSPSGKRAVIEIHGELFSIGTDKGDTRRLTATSHIRETQPRWSPDGKYIAFLANHDGREDIYVCDEMGKNLKALTKGDTELSTFIFAPDGKNILYTTSDGKLLRCDVETGESKQLVASQAGQIGDPQWSPDGQWISYVKKGSNFLNHIYVMPAKGGAEKRVTDEDSYTERLARWTSDGKHLVYLSGGELDAVSSVARGGRGGGGQLFALSLTPEASDPTDQNIDSEAEAQALEKKKPKFGLKGGDGAAEKPQVEVKIDFKGLARRAKRLTQMPDAIGAVVVTPDGKNVVFVTASVEGGTPAQSIWSVPVAGGTPSRVAQGTPPTEGDTGGPPGRRFGGFRSGFAALQFTRDGRTLFYKQGKSIYAMPFSAGLGGGAPAAGGAGRGGRFAGLAQATAPAAAAAGPKGRKLTFSCRVEIDRAAERKQVFQEAWFIMKNRFYAADMHGVDWARVRKTYEPLLAHCGSQEDMHEVVSMMLGELNASHTGISAGFGGGGRGDGAAATRYPGFDLEPTENGYYRVAYIYKRGPADKDYNKLKVGDYILSIEDQDLKSGDNYWRIFASTAGSRWAFTVNSRPQREGAWTVKITPIAAQQQTDLQYRKWVDERRAKVNKLSNGKIGYLHIRQMSEPNLRQFEKDLATQTDKKALIIDQRFNPGGNIDQELLAILQQKQYQINKTRNVALEITRPQRGYFGPMVVLQNERSTSDAEVFPDGFRTLKLGKIVGVTTYGAVIGTGAYQLLDGSTLRTPSMGLWSVGGANLENFGVPPDEYVDITPEDYFAGRDPQVERAVEVLQKQLGQRK
jgi:tricorn protease